MAEKKAKPTTETGKVQNVVEEEVAREEFLEWCLNRRRIKPRLLNDKHGDAGESIDAVVANIMDGTFKIDEDGTITHKLTWPIGEELDNPIESLTYGYRLPNEQLKGFRSYKNPDDNTRLMITACALSGISRGLGKKIDEADLMTFAELSYFYYLG